MDNAIFNDVDLKWMDETITSMDKLNWLYRFACWITGRKEKKWTYKEYYAVLIELNRNTVGETEARVKALNRILELYKYLNNNELPKSIQIYNGNVQ